MGYDGLNRLNAAWWHSPAGGYTPFLSISYDASGQRSGTYRASSSTTYGYDAIGRMSGLAQHFAGGTGNVAESFAYNPASQLTSATRSNDDYAWTGHVNVDRPYAANGLNQYTAAGAASFTYDANGNLTSDGSTSFTYDMENRLVAASGAKGANLRYDPLGRLYEVNGPFGLTRFIYDGDHVAAEYNSAGTVLRRYMWGPGHDEPILWDEGSAVNCSGGKFLHPDRQGSVVALADCWGNRIAVNRYDEYGIPQSGNTGRFQYTGQAWLPELGMYYYKARIYSPTLGRFLQTDPIGYGDGLNWYAYVGSDPVNGIDPSGLAEVFDGPAIDVIGSGNKPCPEETVAAGGGYCIPASIYYGGINPGFASDNRAPIGGATAGLAKGSGYKSKNVRTRGINPCMTNWLRNHFDGGKGFDWGDVTISSDSPLPGMAASTNSSLTMFVGDRYFSNIEGHNSLFFHEVAHMPQWHSGELTVMGYIGSAIRHAGSHDSIPVEIAADQVSDILTQAYKEGGKPCG